MPDIIALRPEPSWQDSLTDLITDPDELFQLLQLKTSELPYSTAALQDFPLRVPRPYAARMQTGDPRDPLLLQVLPDLHEMLAYPGYSKDPVGERHSNPLPGLLHKYQGRALLVLTGNCAIHCRYCFRRHFPYADNRPARHEWQQSLDYLAGDRDIHEVILSGGDPLAIPDRHLAWMLEQLAALPQIRRIRIHTRLPIMIPARINTTLCALLQKPKARVSLVLHCNHARELDADVAAACARLQSAGVTLLNQSVLLKGINDNLAALRTLSEELFSLGVLPYYLHLLDKVQGSAHFDVSETTALALLAQLRACLPGYLVPRLAREIAGEPGKTVLA